MEIDLTCRGCTYPFPSFARCATIVFEGRSPRSLRVLVVEYVSAISHQVCSPVPLQEMDAVFARSEQRVQLQIPLIVVTHCVVVQESRFTQNAEFGQISAVSGLGCRHLAVEGFDRPALSPLRGGKSKIASSSVTGGNASTSNPAGNPDTLRPAAPESQSWRRPGNTGYGPAEPHGRTHWFARSPS